MPRELRRSNSTNIFDCKKSKDQWWGQKIAKHNPKPDILRWTLDELREEIRTQILLICFLRLLSFVWCERRAILCCEIYQLLVNLFCHEPNRGFSFKTDCPEKVSFGHKNILENKDDVKPPVSPDQQIPVAMLLKPELFSTKWKKNRFYPKMNVSESHNFSNMYALLSKDKN